MKNLKALSFLFISVFCCALPQHLVAQKDYIIFKNVKEIDPDRYSEIKGSPYLFKDFNKANLYDRRGGVYKNVPINYNAEDNNIEALKDDKNYITVEPKDIPRIVVPNDPSSGLKNLEFLDSLVFVHGPNLKSKSPFHIILHNDKNIKLFLEFYVAINSVTDRPPGEIIERKRFNRGYKMILVDEKLGMNRFKLSKKDVTKALAPYGDISKWCKKNKVKVNEEESVTTFLREYCSSL